MTLADWPRVKPVLEGALARDGAEREAYLDEVCAADPALRAQIESLLADQQPAGSFLETPAALMLAGSADDGNLCGRVVGAYRIESLIGAGGMGEVYRARDTRLNRDVALKVLPDAVAADADRLARFRREAQVLASLNHPHIGSIYGFEESGRVHALVLELVDGHTLADRITQGPLPIDEALAIARQIAAAIEAAHEQGIVHRDLKPANIKLRPDETVKVLDFGLAKALDRGSAAASSLSKSPTPAIPSATQIGMILGTASYMSPEQARGKPVDKRTDIWAFGCVLYEMLTGRRPFDGDDVAEIVVAIIEREPDFSSLPASTPVPIRRLLRRCLQKDRAKRLPDIGVARIEIDDALAAGEDVDAPAIGGRSSLRNASWTWIAATALIVASAAAVLWYTQASPQEPRQLIRSSIPIGDPLELAITQPALAISPDGTRIVYRTLGGGPLHVRPLNEAASTVIAGTEGAVTPFFSPDGRWLGFFMGPALKKVSFTGGAVVTVAELPVNAGAQEYRGAAWADNGTIVFASSTGAGLFSVSENGGQPKPLTTLDPDGGEMSHRWPHVLPGSKAVLYTVKSANLESFDDAQIIVRSLDTGAQHPVAQGGSAHYVSTGHLLYARAGALYAVRFDVSRLAATGEPIKVADKVITHPNSGAAQFAISNNGTLVYAAGDSTLTARPLMWVDRSGAARPVADREAAFWWPRISPDGRRIAVDIDAAFSKIWVVDVERGTLTRASQLAGNHERVEWLADGTRITFSADPTGSGTYRIFSDKVDGTGTASLLFDSEQSSSPLDWSGDGQWLLYRQSTAATGHDLWVYSVADRKSMPFLQTKANESLASLSPDHRWVAYVSDESGRPEVYVRPFPGPGTRTPISVDGGTAPLWSRDGRELFFARGDTLFAVPVTTGTTFTSGAARALFSGPYGFDDVYLNYDVAPDGQHFVMPRSRVDLAPRQLELVLNWFDELNRLSPNGAASRQ